MSDADPNRLAVDALLAKIDVQSGPDRVDSRKSLARQFFARFPLEDLALESLDHLFDRLVFLDNTVAEWNKSDTFVLCFNPSEHGLTFAADRTVLTVICNEMPFCTASVRGELHWHERVIRVLASCNLRLDPEHQTVLESDLASQKCDVLPLSLLYFELDMCSSDTEREQIAAQVRSVMSEVESVVSDFKPMQQALLAQRVELAESRVLELQVRHEYAALLDWLAAGKVTLLGYEAYTVAKANHMKLERSLGLSARESARNAPALNLISAEWDLQDLRKHPVRFSKSRVRSRVHRLAYPNYIDLVTFDASGRVSAIHRFLCLLTFTAYSADPREIPLLRQRIAAVLDRAGLQAEEHDGRELLRVIELYPRDELFQADSETLFQTVTAINRIQERRQTRVFVRQDTPSGFVNCLVYVPRDIYTTELRLRIQTYLETRCQAQESEFTTQFSESVLVRVHFILKCEMDVALSMDADSLEADIQAMAQGWGEQLDAILARDLGRPRATELMDRFGRYFKPGFQSDFEPQRAALDILHMLRLRDGDPLVAELVAQDPVSNTLALRLYHRVDCIPLSDVLPVLEHFGLRVLSERPYEIGRSEAIVWIQDFSVEYQSELSLDRLDLKRRFEDAFIRVWQGTCESDSFNRLLLGTRLDWRQIAVLRAYARYSKQITFAYSLEFMADALAVHCTLAEQLVGAFDYKFGLDQLEFDEDAWRGLRAEFEAGVEQVENLGQDRVLRHYWALLEATVRTNFSLPGSESRDYITLKFDPSRIPGLVEPVPFREIYVYSPRIEGVHLRGGLVARGGLRWSDRSEDFRTEVLGLVKAQQVKNAVIVPVGAKGGFVVRESMLHLDQAARFELGKSCYQSFINALLEITDNQDESGAFRPSELRIYDNDDPYFVVAADKGTATFSDLANAISDRFEFWLGDAFASGGSKGYDHKKMGITARGAWVSVERHFRELGVDVNKDPIRVVGIGDMSGDVFGNGMLLSRSIQLVAAFNHRHIFIDPTPDGEASFDERARLFRESKGGWADYRRELISAGGGVFSRDAKAIALSPEIKTLFNLAVERCTPNELITAMLKAPSDLLWNGGIGTYVKGASETHLDVGDKANDAIRINGLELGARVVGEGGNLGLTQRGRIEYALAGGRCNTDFIDNAGGVDCSDHEVNIKIFLNALVKKGDMSPSTRDERLRSYEDSVARHVLHNNASQTLAISLLEQESAERLLEYKALISELENQGVLNRRLEALPSDEMIAERRAQGLGLSRPELAVLLSASKSHLKMALVSGMPANAVAPSWLRRSFPSAMVREFGDALAEHPLNSAIIATQLANDMVNRLGPNVLFRQVHATGGTAADLAVAYARVIEMFNVEAVWDDIVKKVGPVDPAMSYRQLLSVVQLIKRTVRWFLRNRVKIDAGRIGVTDLNQGVRALLSSLSSGNTPVSNRDPTELALLAQIDNEYTRHVVANADSIHLLPSIVSTSQSLGLDAKQVYETHNAVGTILSLDFLANSLHATTIDSEWRVLARDAYLEEISTVQQSFVAILLAGEKVGCVPEEDQFVALLDSKGVAVNRWFELVAQFKSVDSPDFAVFAVLLRELAELARQAGGQ
jgi:glutamate dehydrogenase